MGAKNLTAAEKKLFTQDLFGSIARRYDLANSILSLGFHYWWRHFALGQVKLPFGGQALDLCSGTGSLALALAEKNPSVRVWAVDFCPPMITLGCRRADEQGLAGRVSFTEGDVEKLNFPKDTFDVVTVGFGLRNVSDVDKMLKEAYRVLKPRGQMICLEFSRPPNDVLRWFYFGYLSYIVPWLGRLVTGNLSAYRYLAQSIKDFLSQEELVKTMEAVGFREVRYTNLTGGIVAVHQAIK